MLLILQGKGVRNGVWDGRVRGRVRTNIGAPQGLPVSPVLFLVWMAPIIIKMETALTERFQAKRAEIEILSYVDDLQSGIYIWWQRKKKLGMVPIFYCKTDLQYFLVLYDLVLARI